MDYDGRPRLRVDYGRTSPDSRSCDRPDGPQLLVPVEDVSIDRKGNGLTDTGGFEKSVLPKAGHPTAVASTVLGPADCVSLTTIIPM
jgi:hypothetical protein